MISRVRESDRLPVVELLRATGRFTDREISIAEELIAIVLGQPEQEDYHAFVDRRPLGLEDRLSGLLILGQTPATTGTWHVYWIAVHPDFQGNGVAQELDSWAVSFARDRGAYWLLAETSSQPAYERARRFYRKQNYLPVAQISDYYKASDDLVIFGKRLPEKVAEARPGARNRGLVAVLYNRPVTGTEAEDILAAVEDVRNALELLEYRTVSFDVDRRLDRLVEFLGREHPALIFNLVESVENESALEMNVAGIFELSGIPYTGSDPLALGTALDKARVKEILTFHGVRTPAFQAFPVGHAAEPGKGLEFPLIVKPVREDASLGVSEASVVESVEDLRLQLRAIWTQFRQPALVEQFVEGRELNVAVIGNANPIVLPVSEIDFSGLNAGMRRIVSYAAKWDKGSVEYAGTRGVCPAPLDSEVETRVKEMAVLSYTVVGCRDYARVDFRLTDDGVPYVLEVNPNPDISRDAGFMRSSAAAGHSYEQMIGMIVESALERVRNSEVAK